jgi:hypothetical protein
LNKNLQFLERFDGKIKNIDGAYVRESKKWLDGVATHDHSYS